MRVAFGSGEILRLRYVSSGWVSSSPMTDWLVVVIVRVVDGFNQEVVWGLV